MAKWRWVEELESTLDTSEFLEDNDAGAAVGGAIGGGAGVGAMVVIAVATAPTVGSAAAAATASTTGAAAAAAAGGELARRTYTAGFAVGHRAGVMTRAAVFGVNGFQAAYTLGRAVGSYGGAGVQAGGRWIGRKVSNS